MLAAALAAALLIVAFTAVKTENAAASDSADVASANDASIDFMAEYAAVSYDSYDGLVSAEINAIAQTKDGYIWVGTYSGLYRYDGKSFEKSTVSPHIYNVMSLFVDSRGRLWIGTNDTGLFAYDPDSKMVARYTVNEGLPSDSIRSIW